MSLATAADAAPPSGILIERVSPELDCGRYPVKREVGDVLEVSADIFREGHDHIGAVLCHRREDEAAWHDTPMRHVDNDRWSASVPLPDNTRYRYTILAYPDPFESWRDEVTKKLAAGLDVASELLEGRALIADAAYRAAGAGTDGALLDDAIAVADAAPNQEAAADRLLADDVASAVGRHASRAGSATYDRELTVVVDRVAARYAAWYEFFPRSAGTVPGRSATFAEAETRLPAIAAMGFDVVYFPPIHPIGRSHRKGPNNTLHAGPDDPGVPYAIGNELGGHDAVEPSLGTLEDFRHFVGAAREHGMEVALDFAATCSPDHPWVREHPEWFAVRPDGTIKYAENPPKKYQDIYPINFSNPDWRGLWAELRRVILHWVAQGVTTFRVDNPHTKPTVFWEWLIAEVQRNHPEVVFLSEAFTRPKVMKALAKAGFTQSYTYFTWRNHKAELRGYFEELTQSDVREYLRGNLFPNTPDILPTVLQEGGRPAFKFRAVLAATLSSVYGIYSGFELCENAAVPGREEYDDSEKYDYKVWDWDRPGNIIPLITALNRIRRAHPALHEYDNLRFVDTSSDHVLAYLKATPDRDDIVLVAVNLDPHQTHETALHVPVADLGLPADRPYRATDLLTGSGESWNGPTQHLRLDPHDEPARLWSLAP